MYYKGVPGYRQITRYRGTTMGTATFRADYAKFLITCDGDLWREWYHELNNASHERKYKADWLKSHRVNRLWVGQDGRTETWAVDIWGEWAGIAECLSDRWWPCLRRYDVRAIVWDADEKAVQSLGTHLFNTIRSISVQTYSRPAAQKRMGRDRGGVGFAVGSHKSDCRITCYKRTGEPVALEYQITGQVLAKLMGEVNAVYEKAEGTIDRWQHLKTQCQAFGDGRLTRTLDAAGIGGYWPVLGPIPVPDLPPTQFAFLAQVEEPDLAPPPEYTG